MYNLAVFRMEDFRTFKEELIEEILKAMSLVKSDNEHQLLLRTELAQMLGV